MIIISACFRSASGPPELQQFRSQAAAGPSAHGAGSSHKGRLPVRPRTRDERTATANGGCDERTRRTDDATVFGRVRSALGPPERGPIVPALGDLTTDALSGEEKADAVAATPTMMRKSRVPGSGVKRAKSSSGSVSSGSGSGSESGSGSDSSSAKPRKDLVKDWKAIAIISTAK